jgi:hypothetical protein
MGTRPVMDTRCAIIEGDPPPGRRRDGGEVAPARGLDLDSHAKPNHGLAYSDFSLLVAPRSSLW